MNTEQLKSYRAALIILMSFSFIIALTGLILMINTRGSESISILLTKIGIGGVLLSYIGALYMFIKQSPKIPKSTKVALWVVTIISLPIVFGLIQVLFVV